ncbi:MAG: hypothetical protein EU533_03430 [Promethearchaeota archaeon]|nr:MAG: hypothetical protein EU533_03430 [Candidatus Lokiarchaeota archaeon]
MHKFKYSDAHLNNIEISHRYCLLTNWSIGRLNMLELYTPNYEEVNTKERVTVDLLKDGMDFLEKSNINQELKIDTINIVYRFLKHVDKIPHNLYKFYIAAYYIVSRHPFAFPTHQTKEDFCNNFGIKVSSLEYSVNSIVNALNYIKILDDMNFPYYIDPKNDLSLKLIKSIVKNKVDKAMMNFLLYNSSVNSQILTEELVCDIIFEHRAFPEELLRQLYEIVFEFIEKQFTDYNEYVNLQQKYFI